MNNTIFINGDITPFAYGWDGLYDIANLNNDLNAIDKTDLKELIVDINTFGGDVTAGFAMANILRRFASENSIEITTRISGYCSSIGTVIFLAGDKRIGNEYADFFVHNAWTFAVGDKNEMKKQYENLDEVSNKIAKYYSEKTTIPFEEALKLMDESTNIDSETALKYGFFSEIENSVLAYNSKSIRNLLIQNNKKITNLNINNSDMQTNEKKGILNKVLTGIRQALGINNLIVYTDTQDELDFYELQDGDVVKIGDKATINGEKANGAFMLADGKSLYTFENEVLTKMELQEDEDTPEPTPEPTPTDNSNELNAKIVEKDNEILNLKNEIETLKNKFVELKGLTSNFKIELDNEEKENAPEPINKKIDFNEKIKNFKF
jgi:ATP-dependent protease ClpP protease subunit